MTQTTTAQWRYTVIPMVGINKDTPASAAEYIDIMNSLGAGGWELVAVHTNELIFKKVTCLDSK